MPALLRALMIVFYRLRGGGPGEAISAGLVCFDDSFIAYGEERSGSGSETVLGFLPRELMYYIVF